VSAAPKVASAQSPASATRQVQLLDALVGGEAPGDVAGLAARVFSLPENGRYAVVARLPVSGAAPAHHPPSTINGMRALWRTRPNRQIGIVVLGDAEPTAVAEALPATPGWRVGVSLAVDGLAGLFRGPTATARKGRRRADACGWSRLTGMYGPDCLR
jgi:hypothetical protein